MRGYPSYRRPSNRARRATTLVGGFAVLLMLFLLSREAGFVAWGLEPVGPSIAQPLEPSMGRGPQLQTTPVSAEVSPLRPAQEVWSEPEPATKLTTPRLSSPKGSPTIVEPRFKPIDLPALADPDDLIDPPKETAGILSPCDATDCNDEIRDDEDRLSAAVAEVIEDGDGKGDDDPPGDVDDDGDHHGDDDGGGYSGGGDGDCDNDQDRDDVAENEHDGDHDGDDDHHGDGDDDDDDDDDDDSSNSGSGGGHHHS